VGDSERDDKVSDGCSYQRRRIRDPVSLPERGYSLHTAYSAVVTILPVFKSEKKKDESVFW
jgi:hypothetical protein